MGGQFAPVEFEPMDARHLSSLPLVRARVIKLLKASRNNLHPANNIIVTLVSLGMFLLDNSKLRLFFPQGFTNPTKTDRRFFQTRIRELVQQGVVERVTVPHKKAQDSSVKCFRLVASDASLAQVEGAEVTPDLAEDDDEVDEGALGN